MVSPGTALRGEVWACALPAPIGPHPVVVLTANRIAAPLSAMTVAVITGTAGPSVTHVPIGKEAGLTKYDESYVNCTDLHTVAKSRLRRKLGTLAPGELRSVEASVRLVLGLQG
ncbi:type II toxin-antitoxin system PemK/MazF family toxin [Actinocorallia libanotica]|uniref:mRNA interferase MazF n=1 Tax=Actinocorallia libanotica TaxID=46162 RepID=A0ABP4AUG2_9ACTN